MEENKDFDKTIKDQLNRLEEQLPSDAWAIFEQKSADISPSPQEDEAFDESIKSHLGQLSVPSAQVDWDAFSELLAEEELPSISDETLDQKVQANLQNLEVPYNAAHWTLMSHRLKEEFSIRRKIVRYKVAEIAVMALLMFTINQYIPLLLSTGSSPRVKQGKPIPAPSSTASAEWEKGYKSWEKSFTSLNERSSVPLSSSRQPIESIEQASFTKNKQSKNISLSIPDFEPIPVDFHFPTSSPPSWTVSNLIAKDIRHEHGVSQTAVALEEVSLSAESLNFDFSPIEDGLPIRSILLNSEVILPQIGAWKKFKDNVKVEMGMVSAMDMNRINTPAMVKSTHPAYAQNRMGYSGGFMMNMIYEKFSFETGFLYKRLDYAPKKEINVAGSFTQGYQSYVFNEVNLDMLSLPFNFKFQMNDKGSKWKFFALTGSSLNLLAVTNYNVKVDNLGDLSTNSINIPSPTGVPTLNPQQEYQENRIASKGLFEAGSFQRNHYFSVNIGMGVERLISHRWTVFAQPIYQFEAFGKKLGPNKDRIHSMSLQLGIKSTIKN